MAYNGWKNRETWNVALWIGNDEGLYHVAREAAMRNPRSPYADFVSFVAEISPKTPDGVTWTSRKVSKREINRMMRELAE